VTAQPPSDAASGDSPETAALATHLAAVLEVASIDHLVRLSGGASRETWRFVAGGAPLILQRQRPGDVRNMETEAEVLRRAGDQGAPVPEVLASGREDTGAQFIVTRSIDGETIARKILRDEEFAHARRVLAGQLGAAAARIHAIDPEGVTGLEYIDPLERYRTILDMFDEAHPAFELAFAWLEEHRPAVGEPTLVHGDFRLGNVIVGPDGLRAVLDWELAHLGDPMEDLGWLCVRAWRFGSEAPVAGIGAYEELFLAYEQAGGRAVDPDVVRWWEVLGTVQWGVMCMIQASAHLTGQVRSHELAAIGRRVCENEYDVFLALEGYW
jgi:aminoglycoside phosphotransferase (APT) family kinase protein